MNADPVAVDDDLTSLRDEIVHFAPAVTANDSDPDGDSLSVIGWSGSSTQGGTLDVDGNGQPYYAPPPGFVGDDSFAYQIDDGQGGTAWGTVTLHVTAPPNVAPTAGDRAFDLAEDLPLSVAPSAGLLQGATDPDGPALTALLVAGPAHGALTLQTDGSFEYAPDAHWNGTDTFTYAVSDGIDSSAPYTVTLNVAAVNDAPTWTPGVNATAYATDGLVVVRNWAIDLAAGPADEAGQHLWVEATLQTSEDQFFYAHPQVDSDGTLWFATSGIAGDGHLTLRLRDDGGTDLGGSDASAPTTILIQLVDPQAPGGVPWSDAADLPPTAAFEHDSLYTTAAENVSDGKIRFQVRLSKPWSEDAVLGWYVETGIAGPQIDFLATSGTLTIAAGATTGTIEIPIVNDHRERDPERTFRVQLYAKSNVRIENEAEAIGVVYEDDATLSIAAQNGAVLEAPPNSAGEYPEEHFILSLSRGLDRPLTVNVGDVGINAESDDYALLDSTVTFAPGETSKIVRVRILDDHEQSIDPNDANVKRGEVTEYYRVNISVDDPSVHVTLPYAVSGIYDDDWEQYALTQEGGWRTEWVQLFDPAQYPEGTIIDAPPLGPGFVVPPDWEGYGEWLYTYVEDQWEWMPMSPIDEPRPTIQFQRLDEGPVLEADDAKARYRIFVNGNYEHLPITVHYTTVAISADADEDFDATGGSVTISDEYGYAEVEIAVHRDEANEPGERFGVYFESNDGAIPATPLADVVTIDEIRVTHVTFRESNDPHGGKLEENSGAAGFRLFPDAQVQIGPDGQALPGTDSGRNLVVVRALVSGLEEGDRVYFRVFDVDDPSRADADDGESPTGNDNFGRLDVVRDAAGDILDDSHFAPGIPNGGGARYLLRGLDAQGNGNAWYGDGQRQIVSGIVRRDPTGFLYAEAELLTTFQPGDNFRVVALPQPEPGNDWDPNDGSTPAAVEQAFQESELAGFADRQPGFQPTLHGAKASPLLTVWRQLHMEIDRMSDMPGDEDLGDRVTAVVVEQVPGMFGTTEVTVKVTPAAWDPRGWTGITDHSFEGGLLRYDGKNYDIADSRLVGEVLELVVKKPLGVPLDFSVGTSFDLFEDDFVRPEQNGNNTPQLRIAPNRPGLVDVVKRYMQSGPSANANRFADAFIQPEYGALASFSGFLPRVNHLQEAQTTDPNVTINGTNYRGSAALNSSVFWTSYLAIAYQFTRERDYDTDLWVNGAKHADETGDPLLNPFAPTSVKGITGNENLFETSFVFVESIWDHWAAHRKLDPSDPQFHQSQNPEDALARTAIHEIAHQLGGTHPLGIDGIMTEGTHKVAPQSFFFGADSLKELRSQRIVGKPNPKVNPSP